MSTSDISSGIEPVAEQAHSIRELLESYQQKIYRRTDRLFAGLMAFQWVAGIVAAQVISPRTWLGAQSETHLHLWAAVLLGGLISSVPILFAITRPGAPLTRHVIACGQMLMSALLIHLCGGRIETHFHIFGSLAFLAFYRDWTVLITATIVVAADHFLRGVYWPQSVFGVLDASQWRWVEHAAWVVFEDIFLLFACLQGEREMSDRAEREIQLTTLSKLRSQQAEENAAQEARVRAILDSTADAIVTVGDDGCIRSYNQSTNQMFGFSGSNLQGEQVALLSPELHQQIIDANGGIDHGREKLTGREQEIRCQTLDGGKFSANVRVTRTNHNGDRLSIATIQDITSRKAAEVERERLFKAIGETANHLSSSSAEISATMIHESAGMERQALAVSDTVSTVAQASRTAEESTHLARNVAETARLADDVSKSGRKAIEETRDSMNEVREQVKSTANTILTLAERAQTIGEIIDAVNDVAEQTNVLALNASVEASRAGEAGRGFAVVAAEVKSLADRAKKATAQVRQILGEIQQATNNAVLSTERGTNSVAQASNVVASAEKTIDELSTMVGQAAQAAVQIVSASSEQAASMHQIAQSMEEIDRTAKKTLDATRQTENAANDLNTLGLRLRDLLERRDATAGASSTAS